MADKIVEKYLKAGKAVAKALELAKKIVRPGTKYLDLATLIEGEILDNGCELSFPINVSLDRQAAHYSPIIDDKAVVPEHGLLKIDCGSHFDGYIADSAITINLGNDDGIYKTLIDAAADALDAALINAKPGVDVTIIGRVIQDAMNKHGVKPISNLGGHGLEQYNLHTGIFIPNTPAAGRPTKLELGKAYAIEPFSTNGAGRITNGKQQTIFQVVTTKKKNMKLVERSLANKFKEKFTTLPFSPRAIDFIQSKQKINDTVEKFVRKGILMGYPVFLEVGGGLVAQKEHTFIVTKEGAKVTTQLD